MVAERGAVGQFDAAGDRVAYAFATPRDLPQLYFATGAGTARKLVTDLNAAVLARETLGEVESFTFVSNDNKFDVEGFLTRPVGMSAASRHPMIVMIHGGPHGQQGPAFNFQSQVYAARGWARSW